MSIPRTQYFQYKSAIKTANDDRDKDRAKASLREIQRQLIVQYGANDDDVQYLLKMFYYDV